MPHKDPTTYPYITYFWVFFISVWGGIINFKNKMKQGILVRFSLAELVGDIATSAFVGIITFYICESANITPVLTAAIVGISGHMGARLLFTLEKIVQKKLEKILK